ncbi:MAG: sulfite exporter TauE/SafE family protein [Proteobacteria bacterium]|nr:sulfite exporter TauE/SafE family protein [Pseudomonadota bacterium]
MTGLEILSFFLVSALGAAINSVAGGGTFLTFPVFILNGLTASQANIMSTIALWPGVLSSAYGYRGQMQLGRHLLPYALIGVGGGTAGALWFLATPEATFARLVPWLLLAATCIFTFGRGLMRRMNPARFSPRLRTGFAVGLQITIGIYGGYFGAGIGILTLAMLQLLGHDDIHRMNALKTVLTAAVNLATVVVFICSGSVLWGHAAIMVAGAVCGGYAGARLALRASPKHVRWLVSAIGFSMTAYFFLHG